MQTPQLDSFGLPKSLDVHLQGLSLPQVLIDLSLPFGTVAG
ncbi:MAG: hypothetical protein NT037_15730 [Hyphomicrobiales bacterium]|nr:hypothetical protein [Hyphomicrobiales bacterium]